MEAALAGDAVYADARARSPATRGAVGAERRDRGRRSQPKAAGVGVRARRSSWGFAATSDLEAAETAGSRAAAIAHASALVPGPDLHLAEVPVAEDRYVTPVLEDPFAVPLSEKADLVVGVCPGHHRRR